MRSLLTALIGLCLAIDARAGSPIQKADDAQGSSWHAQISRDIQREEYAFHSLADEPDVCSAPNRSHELRSRVSCTGIEVFPRAASADGVGAEWKLALRSVSFGRLGDLHELGAASIVTLGARVELDHGLLTEWFVNDERGIEQGWTIPERPRGVEPLWIGLEFGGDLSLRIDEGARSGVLVDACGDVKLRYRDLVVFDATGRELDAQLAPSPAGVGIRIDDTNAVYPVTVDPLLTAPAWTAESNQAGALFGISVATAGDVNGDGFSDVIIGAVDYDNGQTNEGRAFVFLGSGAGLGTAPAWTAESDQASARFGISTATAGDVNADGFSDVIVGSDTFDNGQTDEGRTFVYLGSGAGLGTTAAWTAESNQASARFGCSVATAGDVNADGFSDVIVGAYNYDNGQTDEGRAFVYLGSGSGLGASPAWTAESDQASALFGISVATAADVDADGFSDVIVGAYSYDNGQTDEGRAFVFRGSATGLGTSAAWTAESNQVGGRLGVSVATAGDVDGDGFADVIVGAFLYDNGQANEGRAYVYLGSPGGLSASAAWTAESDQASATFGYPVGTAGDVNGDGYSDVIVGAESYSNGQSGEGRAFVYLGSGSGLGSTAAWTAESDQASAFFGAAIATAGDVDGDGFSDVIVGAVVYDNGQADEGRAFVYHGGPSGLATTSGWTAESDQAGARLGTSAATAGDVNGDGFSDVIVGAPSYDNGQADEGRAFVYLGSTSGLATSAAWTAESNQAGASFGVGVATAGDVNGDGYSDVIVGANQYDNGQTDEGRAFVYLGSMSGLDVNPAWTAESDQSNAWFGGSVARGGDVDGDGFGDVIVGASQYGNGQANEGRAFVYLGSASGPAASAAWTAESNQSSARFGICVATAGDVDRDGFSDVIVGAPLYINGGGMRGRAYVYQGSGAGLSASAAWTAESDQMDGFFSNSVAAAGDVNGDGFSDVIVGEHAYSNGEPLEGRALVYLGSATGLGATAAWSAESDQVDAQFGFPGATAGDVNGDGFSDVIVGSHRYDNGQTDEGRAFLYFGGASGLATSASWTAESDQADARLGLSVATAGDVNGDGYSDVIVAASFFDGGQTDEGRAFIYLGNAGRGGWTLAPQQRRASDTAPIDLLGRSNNKSEFRIKLGFERELAGFAWASGLTPKARLEWEVAPLRASLDGSRIESGAEQTITGSPLAFNELAEFVAPGPFQLALGIAHHVAAGCYHWRARVRTNNPIFPVTPWVSIPWNNVTETKLRVGPLHATRIAR